MSRDAVVEPSGDADPPAQCDADHAGGLLRDNQRKYMDQNYPLERRLCAYLLRLADRNNRVAQSQGYIANLASCSRQSVNRALGQLREEGLITIEKGKIRLLDRDGLERKLAGQ